MGWFEGLFGEDDTLNGVGAPSPAPKTRRAGWRYTERIMNQRRAILTKKPSAIATFTRRPGTITTVARRPLPGAIALKSPAAGARSMLVRHALSGMLGLGDVPGIQLPGSGAPAPTDPNAPPPPVTDPNQPPDQVGVPPGWVPKNWCWVSDDLFSAIPDAQCPTFSGQRAKMRFAVPAIDMSAILSWPEYDEYGKVNPEGRCFDNRPDPSIPHPDPFAGQFQLDNLRWDQHPPIGRALVDMINSCPGLIISDPSIVASYITPNFCPLKGPNTHQDYYPLVNWTRFPCDFWRLDNNRGSAPDWYDPFLPIPIDLLSYQFLGVVPDGVTQSPSDYWGARMNPNNPSGLTHFLNLGGIQPPWIRQQPGFPQLGQTDRDYAHSGRGVVTVYSPSDIPGPIGAPVQLGPGAGSIAAQIAAQQAAIAAGALTPGAQPNPIDPATGLPYDANTGQLIDPTTGQAIPGQYAQGMAPQPTIDPTTGLPIDPTTGMPVGYPSGAPGGYGSPAYIDPSTGQPYNPMIDPATGYPLDMSNVEQLPGDQGYYPAPQGAPGGGGYAQLPQLPQLQPAGFDPAAIMSAQPPQGALPDGWIVDPTTGLYIDTINAVAYDPQSGQAYDLTATAALAPAPDGSSIDFSSSDFDTSSPADDGSGF